jgi:hypothetical protein
MTRFHRGINYRVIIRGLLGYISIFLKFLNKGKGAKGTGGTDNPDYCFSVWMRHLIKLHQAGMESIPETIAELGPGDSLGTGMTALLLGVKKYYAFDIIHHSYTDLNLEVLYRLVQLLRQKPAIPDTDMFPLIKPEIDDTNYPYYLEDRGLIKINFDDEYVGSIKESIMNMGLKDGGNYRIEYKAPWTDSDVILNGTVDLIYSQAVMEHIMDLEFAYKKMFEWLKVGGYISHQIDYSAHETHKICNGHWGYPAPIWKIIMNGRSYPINRKTHTEQLYFIEKAGFEILNVAPVYEKGLTINELNKNKMNPDDLNIRSAHIIARK